MIGAAHEPVLLHPFDQASGVVVADAQVALDEAGAGLLRLGHDVDGLGIHVRLLIAAATAGEPRTGQIELAIKICRFFGDGLDIIRHALCSPEIGDRFHLAI